jgi:hypothetical protein
VSVAFAVPWQERDRRTGEPSHRDVGGRRAVRRVDRDLGDVVEELVEAAAADHGDSGCRCRHAPSLPS